MPRTTSAVAALLLCLLAGPAVADEVSPAAAPAPLPAWLEGPEPALPVLPAPVVTPVPAPVPAPVASPTPTPGPAPLIKAIVVVGNGKTTDHTVKRIADISVGQEASRSRIDGATARLVTCELFSAVKIESRPVAGGVEVVMTVHEKQSWIVAPTFYVQPGNVGGGVGFLESNFLGEDKKLLLYGQYATADRFGLAIFVDPSVNGSLFYTRYDIYLRDLSSVELIPGDHYFDQQTRARLSNYRYLDGAVMLGYNIRRTWAVDARVRGARVTYRNARTASEPHTPLQAPEDDGWDFSTEYRLVNEDRSNWYGVKSGRWIEARFEHALPGVGYQYLDATLRAERDFRILKEHNLVLKSFLGIGYHLPYQQEYAVGGEGFKSLRGYRNGEFGGDTLVNGTVEYSVPFFKISSLAFRGLAFWDSAFTTFTGNAGNPHRHYLPGETKTTWGQFRNGVGAGFRIYFRSIVVPLLGMDFARGMESGQFQLYFAVGLTNF